MNLQGLGLVLAGSALIAGCAADLPEDSTGDDEASGQHAIHSWVVVERIEGDGGVRTNVSAKFLSVADADVSVAQRLVGARPEIPTPGECVPLASLEKSAQLENGELEGDKTKSTTVHGKSLSHLQSLSLDLLDVGNVSLSIHEATASSDAAPLGDEPVSPAQGKPTHIALSPRAFPDIGDLVSGVFYTSPDAATAFPVPGNYEIGGSGSMSMDAFAIDVEAPDAPRNVVIAGVPADGSADQADEIPSLRRGEDIELAWAAASSGAVVPAGQIVYVDVRTGSGAHRCAFADGGGAVLPAGIIGADDVGAEATITLHRLTERTAGVRALTSVPVEELHDATVVFDFARSVAVRVR